MPFPENLDAARQWVANELFSRGTPKRRGRPAAVLTLKMLVDGDGQILFRFNNLNQLRYPTDYFKLYELWYHYEAAFIDPTKSKMQRKAKGVQIDNEDEKSKGVSLRHAAQTLAKVKKKRERAAARGGGMSDADLAAQKKLQLKERWHKLRRGSILDIATKKKEVVCNKVVAMKFPGETMNKLTPKEKVWTHHSPHSQYTT
jgi:hypothetical protein